MKAAAPGVDSPLHRHAWILDSLPTRTEAVIGRGDPTLDVYLEACGLAAADDARADAVVAEVPAGAGPERLLAAVEPAGADLVAVAIGGGPPGPPPTGVPRPLRALQLLGSPAVAARAAITARRAAALLRERGFEVAWSATGDRSRRYGIGRRGWAPPSRPPLGWALTASRGESAPSIVADALAAAGRQAGTELRRRRAAVLESGKVLVEARSAGGEDLILRLAADPTAQPLADSADCLLAIAAASDDRRLLDRFALPRARGRSGPTEFSLEPALPGGPPRQLTHGFEEQVLGFLVALRGVATPAAPALTGPSPELQVERMLGVLDDCGERAAVRRVAAEVESRVGALRGGIGHGDFWHENLLERNGDLVGVVDWEWCSREALPMIDLFDFLALSQGRVTQPTPGVRFTALLWPLAQAGGAEALVQDYCRQTGVPGDQATLEGFAAAYWLDRASRELLPLWGRRDRPDWIAANVRQPLALLREAGW